MPARTRTRSFARAPQRRKRVWARSITNGTVAPATPVHFDLLTNFQSAAGLTAPPGVTVGGLRVIVTARATAASPNNFTLDKELTWGILISSPGVDPGDILISASAGMHLDYMWWENRTWNHTGGEFDNTQRMDRQVRSMRRMDEVGFQLIALLDSTGSAESVNFTLAASALLILP